jgi:hypothetical protein
MPDNKLRGNKEIFNKLQSAETYYNSLGEYDFDNWTREQIVTKQEAYNKCHELRRLYYDRH